MSRASANRPSGQLTVPTPVACTCGAERDTRRVASFYWETDPPGAVITYGDDQVIGFLQHSGRGARYRAEEMEFWAHHGEVTVNWHGTTLRCRARPASAARAFVRALELQGITSDVPCLNDASLPTLHVAPVGLEIDNRPISQRVDGIVTGAEIADLDADGSPELYVYVHSVGSGSYGSLVAYAANDRKSLSQIYLPPVAGNPETATGYMGHDEFAVVGRTFVRRFPIYREGDTNARPTGGTRELRYTLVPGEAGWFLRLDTIVEY